MKKLRLIVAVSFMFTSLWSFGQKYGSTAEDSAQCVRNISLYREYFKQWKSSGYKSEIVKDCIKPWREALLNCPKSTKYLYVDGPKIVAYLYENADAAAKDKIFDTLKMVYDMRIEHFGQKGKVLGMKAVDMIQMQPQKVDEVYAAFVEAVDVAADKASPVTLVYFMQSAINIAKNGEKEELVIFDAFDKAMSIAEKNPKRYAKAIQNLENMFEPYASCENLIPMFSKKYAADPENVELLRKITDLLDRKGCTEDPLFLKAAKALYEIEPSPSAAIKIAKLEVNNGNFQVANDMYLKAIEEETEGLKKTQYYLELSDLSYRKQGANQKAISYARKALAIDPNLGSAYMLIGDIIASTKGCGENPVENKSVYWLAVDYYVRAKNVDPSVANEANKRIATYSKYFPNKEDAFFYGITEGASVTVPCYGESTSARF